MVDGGLESLDVPQGVAVHLGLDRLVELHPHGLAAEVVDHRRLVAVLQHHLGHHAQPAHHGAGGHDHEVQEAVVELGVGHQHDPRRELPAVADHDGAHQARDPRPAVQAEAGPPGAAEQVARPCVRVRGPAHEVLEVVLGVGHDLRVEARTAHDQEAVVLGAAVSGLQVHDHGVDGPLRAEQGHVHGVVRIREVRLEVAGQQVARAQRHQAQGDVAAGEGLAHRADGAVTARGQHDVGALLHRAARHGEPGIVRLGLVEHGICPACLAARDDDRVPGDVGKGLDGVDHDGHSLGFPRMILHGHPFLDRLRRGWRR